MSSQSTHKWYTLFTWHLLFIWSILSTTIVHLIHCFHDNHCSPNPFGMWQPIVHIIHVSMTTIAHVIHCFHDNQCPFIHCFVIESLHKCIITLSTCTEQWLWINANKLSWCIKYKRCIIWCIKYIKGEPQDVCFKGWIITMG